MRLALVVAMGENRVIGRAGGLPWHIPGDLKLFKKTTLGKPIIMGRKTWESLGRALPGRANIVITRNPGLIAKGADVAADLDHALAIAAQRAAVTGADTGADEIMVIGGAEIYALALPRADRLYLTEVALRPDGDAFFPELGEHQWRQSSRTAFPGHEGSPAFTLVVYDREG